MNKFEELKRKVMLFDNAPIDYLEFKGRIFEKYGVTCFSDKLDYISGKAFENMRDDRNPLKKLFDQKENELESAIDESTLPMLEVPIKIAKDWTKLSPEDYEQNIKSNKALIDEYLESLMYDDKVAAIRVMCKNLKTSDYSTFLDRNMNELDDDENKLADAILEFHRLKKQQIAEYKQGLADLSNLQKETTYNLLEEFKYNKHEDQNESFNPYEKTSRSYGLGRFSIHPWGDNKPVFGDLEPELNFRRYQTINQSDISKLRTQNYRLGTKPETLKKYGPAIVPLQNVRNTNITNTVYTSPISRNTYRNIGHIPNVYNIVDLINARHEVAHKNAELNQKIVSDSISINNVIKSNMQTMNTAAEQASNNNSEIHIKQMKKVVLG